VEQRIASEWVNEILCGKKVVAVKIENKNGSVMDPHIVITFQFEGADDLIISTKEYYPHMTYGMAKVDY
jgi:hypothetical protein